MYSMFEYCLWAMLLAIFFREIRPSRRLVHTYVPILGRPGRSGAQLPIMAISWQYLKGDAISTWRWVLLEWF